MNLQAGLRHWNGAKHELPNVDVNRPLPYKPRQLSAMTRSDRGGPLQAEKAPFGPAITGLTSLSGTIARSAENEP
jgi:hypothetical protein